jgi:HK97 family phage portal protein
MTLHAYRGDEQLDPTPRLLTQPDLDRGGPEFVQLNVEDYLLSGNAICLVTQRGADGWPLAVTWLPVAWVFIMWTPPSFTPTYYYLGTPLPSADVVHIRRGADRSYPVRGVGVVEEHMTSLDRVAAEEIYESNALSDGAVPSVAVITPTPTLTQAVADEAKATWIDKFGGPVREPVILPNGTQVIPLAWSPTDTQLSEARRLSLVDVANMFNLNGYWTNSPGESLTYKSATPQFQEILRTSLEPVLADLEAAWSNAWLPRGTAVRFERAQLLRDDLGTSTTAAVALYNAGLATEAECRVMVGLPPQADGALGPPAPPPPPALPGTPPVPAMSPSGEQQA